MTLRYEVVIALCIRVLINCQSDIDDRETHPSFPAVTGCSATISQTSLMMP